ncbi:MAG: Na/Pi symporter [Pirellulaceae bacterium]|nr:Na/Pi symporter [Pirellulaceae bacterium]
MAGLIIGLGDFGLVQSKISTMATANYILQWLKVAVLVYGLLVAVVVIGQGFKFAAGDRAEELFAFAKNPFLGLMVGIVSTSLIQSSSTVTSIIVGLVAGGLPVSISVPMVMGANIGTSVTNTLVSLGHLRDSEQFRRAFSAATILDMFNVLAVVILLPLELGFHFLEQLSDFTSQWLVGEVSVDIAQYNLISLAVSPAVASIHSVTRQLPSMGAGILEIVLGVVLIVTSITWMGKLLKQLLVGAARELLQRVIGRGPLAGIFSGAAVTVMVQSSSTTTSLIVPLAGGGILSLRQIYPFTLGANIGTCITALMAAAAISGETSRQAFEIALVHFYFNLIGVAIIFGIPILRELPIRLAERLGELVSRQKSMAFAYVGGVFFLLPGLSSGLSWLLGY